MSFFDDASLVFLPSGQAGKDGKAYSMKPTDSSGDFTFSRGSNLTATRVDSNGLIEKGRENLLLQSNSFDTTWTTDNSSVTSGQSGYDGSNDAWKLSGTGGFFPRVQQNKSISGVATFSVYAKSGNVNVLRLLTISGSNTDTKFQLTGSGSILTQTGSERIESKITRLGSTDWYRCSITFNGSPTNFRIYPMSDNLTFAVNGEFIYIQDAQLEQGLVATDYIETGATTVQAGLLEDEPRIDYTGGTGSLLLEPSRTNLASSEYFEQFWSTSSGGTRVYNQITSPEGVQNATKIYPTSTGSFKGLSKAFGSTLSSTSYALSIFAKAGEFEHLYFYNVGSPDGNNGVWFNLTTGSVGTNQAAWTSAKMEDYGNGWYRCSAVITAGGSSDNLYILLADSNGSVTATTSGTDGLYIYGAQMEQGSYPTSYIPNHSGGSVTRNTDVTLSLTNAGADGLINNYNTTIFINLKKIISVNNVIRFVTLFPNGGANNPRVLLYGNMSNALVQYRVTGQADQSITSPYNRDEVNKIAIRISGTSLTMFHNGEEVNTITIVQGDDLEYLSLAESAATDSGYLLNQLLSFPTALSDDECIALTTL